MRNLLLLLNALLFISHLNAQGCNGFFENFETATLNPVWQFGTGTYTRSISSANPALGLNSFEQSSSGSNSFYQGTYANFTSFQPDYISWYMKTNTTNAANGYFVAGDVNIGSDNGIIFCYFNATSELRFFASTGYNFPIVANTWYHIEAKNIDYVNRNMDIFIDGVLTLTDWPFRSNTATSFDQVHFFNLNPATVNYDQVIFGYPRPEITDSLITQPLCFGDTNGAIDLTVITGPDNGSLSFDWSTTDTTEDLSNLAAGTYDLIITDSIGCMTTASFTLIEPTELQLTSTFNTLNCYGDSTGIIDVTVTGGTPMYSFNWNNGSTSEDQDSLVAGSYILELTDLNGCLVRDTIDIVQPPMITVNAVLTPDNGNSAGAIDLTVSGGVAPYTYSWSNTSNTEDLSGLISGAYSVNVSDQNGCSLSDTFQISSTAGLISIDQETYAIWPNPFKKSFVIGLGNASSSDQQFQLMTVDGKILEIELRIQTNGSVEVTPKQDLPRGTYIVSIIQGKKIVNQRLIHE